MFVRFKIFRERPAILQDGGGFFEVDRERRLSMLEGWIILLIGIKYWACRRGAADLLTGHTFLCSLFQDLLKHPGRIPIQRLAQADDFRHELERQFARHVEEAHVTGLRDASIVEGAMGSRKG